MNKRTLLAVGSVALVLALASAGCESSSEGPKVATAQGPAAGAAAGSDAASTGASTGAKESDYDKALRFTRCMNENGVKLPDPVEGEPLQLAPTGGGWALLSTPEFEKCRHFLPTSWPVKADPKEIAEQRAWGECMRQHGAQTPELEPDASGMVRYHPDPTVRYTPEWRAASAACQRVGNPDSIPLTEG